MEIAKSEYTSVLYNRWVRYNIITFNILYEYKRADGAGRTDGDFLEGRLFFTPGNRNVPESISGQRAHACIYTLHLHIISIYGEVS